MAVNINSTPKAAKLLKVLGLLKASCESLIAEWDQEEHKESELPTHTAYDAERTIRAALGSIEEMVCDPTEKLIEVAQSYWTARALHIVTERQVPALLAAAGESGLDVSDIAKKIGIEKEKLARIMQCLASEHIFVQVGTNRYVNNRISQPLVNDETVWAWIVYTGLFNYTAADHLPATLKDLVAGPSYHAAHTALARAIPQGKDVYALLKRNNSAVGKLYEPTAASPQSFPGSSNPLQSSYTDERVFNLAMIGEGKSTATAHVYDYPWKDLGSATVVDVGGGAGGFPMLLCRFYPGLKFVVQDRAPMIEEAQSIWERHNMDVLTSGRVKLMTHNFFENNPLKGAEVYWMRAVIHNWNDEDATKILRATASAMSPQSRMLIAEHVMYPPLNRSSEVYEARNDEWAAPEPLLANYGHAMAYSHQRDLCMMAIMNAVERTPAQFERIVEAAGLRIVKIWHCRSKMSIVECRLL